MIELVELIIVDYIFRSFAVLYLAIASVEFFQWIPWTKLKKDIHDNSVKVRVLDRKPFNCVLCMLLWMGILVAFAPGEYSFAIILAGIGFILFKLMKRLEIFGV